MIFPVQFGINKHLLIFSKTTNFTHAYLFQIALEIMWLPKQIDEIKCNLPVQNVMAYLSAKVKNDFEISWVKCQRKLPEGK